MRRVDDGVADATAEGSPPLSRGDCNLNPPGIGFLELLLEDLRNHGGTVFEQGFWAVAVHRFGNWRMGFRWKVIRAPLTLMYRLMFLFVECAAGISLPYTIRLGRRVRIWHHSGIILHARSIGDRVDIGCGACILGAVTVGDDCKIGANSVVLDDIPAGSTAVGMPARVVRRRPPGTGPEVRP